MLRMRYHGRLLSGSTNKRYRKSFSRTTMRPSSRALRRLSGFSCFLVAATAAQIPFADYPQATFVTPGPDAVPESWKLAERPSVNSTSNFIFETVNSLLQHWPNTRYRNGHTIVPAVVPRGTLLYHGTYKNEIPSYPEWTSVDPEHSYLFCRTFFRMPPDDDPSTDGGCWHLTLVATRPLKVLYFDGSSAAKMAGGSMDTQDLLTWGEVDDNLAFRERERIDKLCEWGKQYNLDGFLRMEMDFEVMLCDFTVGVKPVSFLNIISAGGGPIGIPPKRPASTVTASPTPTLPPSRLPALPQDTSSLAANVKRTCGKPSTPDHQITYRSIEGGTWANRFPGDTRIQVDYTKLISFYDPLAFPSIHASRIGQERWDHRLSAITDQETQYLNTRVEEVLSSFAKQGGGSGIDWKTLLSVITNRFAERLELLEYILYNSTDPSSSRADAPEAEKVLKKAYSYVRSMITPYILNSAVPPKNATLAGIQEDHDWAVPVYKLCATTHTEYLFELDGTFTPSENLLLSAARGVSKEICRVLTNIWADGEELWAGNIKDDGDFSEEQHAADILGFEEFLSSWRSSITDLKAWLDWSVWVKCRPACSFEEMCYLPTWPFFRGRPRRPEGDADVNGNWTFKPPRWLTSLDDGSQNLVPVEEDEWKHPQPKCIRRIEPFTMGL